LTCDLTNRKIKPLLFPIPADWITLYSLPLNLLETVAGEPLTCLRIYPQPYQTVDDYLEEPNLIAGYSAQRYDYSQVRRGFNATVADQRACIFYVLKALHKASLSQDNLTIQGVTCYDFCGPEDADVIAGGTEPKTRRSGVLFLPKERSGLAGRGLKFAETWQFVFKELELRDV
jgi:hypothetical protein